jgi:hypothetical protein
MKRTNGILYYVVWLFIALLSGLVYMKLLLGPKLESSNIISTIVNIYYDIALLQIGSVIGIIIAFLFFIIDYYYIKRKIIRSKRRIVSRIILLFSIIVVVGIIHYLLEKVIDVI